jgi:cellulose biosynthesis protein BcsQ
MGYRVLMLDLDLQGSLTDFYTTSDEIEGLNRRQRLLVDFLGKAFDAEYPALTDYTHPVLPGTKSAVVPTTDSLAYAELNLTVRWFLKDSTRDVRFLLRRELQLKKITNRFDVVLIDCPPLLNTCCVNALAASDFVLAPVIASQQSVDRVSKLLDRLREFRDNLNPHLRLMGFVANRTRGPVLTSAEENVLSALAERCRLRLDKADARFDVFVKQSAAIRRAEDEEQQLTPADDLYDVYRRLAEEVLSRLPDHCRRTDRPATEEGGG